MRLLITGGSGLLGGSLLRLGRDRHQIHATLRRHPLPGDGVQPLPLDLTQGKAVSQALAEVRPQAVIHAAALTEVDYCEDHREEAWEQNVVATDNLARGAAALGCPLIYISTDFIFDGRRGGYSEEDAPNPLNYYALTKLEGEERVRRAGGDYLIARTTIYGWNSQPKTSFPEWIIQELRAGRRPRLFVDLFWSPIFADNLARALYEAVDQGLRGLYHIAGRERCSRFAFGQALMEQMGCDRERVVAGRIEETPPRAPRPRDCSLNVAKAQAALSEPLLGVAEGLAQFWTARPREGPWAR